MNSDGSRRRGSAASSGSTAKQPAKIDAVLHTVPSAAERGLSAQIRYILEPAAVAARYIARIVANEYTKGPTKGTNCRVQTTSIPKLDKPEANKRGSTTSPGSRGVDSPSRLAAARFVTKRCEKTGVRDSTRAQIPMVKLPATATSSVFENPSNSIKTNAEPSVPAIAPKTFATYRRLKERGDSP